MSNRIDHFQGFLAGTLICSVIGCIVSIFMAPIYMFETTCKASIITGEFVTELSVLVDSKISEYSATDTNLNITYENGVNICYYLNGKKGFKNLEQRLDITGEDTFLEENWKEFIAISLHSESVDRNADIQAVCANVEDCGVGTIESVVTDCYYQITYEPGHLTIELKH